MENWNFDKAVAFVDAIQNPVSRRLTRLFLDTAVLHAAKKVTRPNAEFDLLFFVTVISHVTVSEVELVQNILDGDNIDAGWEALAEVLAPNVGERPNG